MSFPERHTVSVTTATGGGATAFTSEPVRGRVAMVTYTAATGSPFASTADFTITTEDTLQDLWVESNVTATQTIYPLTAGDLTTGVASTITEVPINAAFERLKIVVAQGGNTTNGTFMFVVA